MLKDRGYYNQYIDMKLRFKKAAEEEEYYMV